MAQVTVVVEVTIIHEQGAGARTLAERAGLALLRTAHGQPGYFGATARVVDK